MLGRATPKTTLYEPMPGGGLHLRHPEWADYEQWADLRLESRDYLVPWEPKWSGDHLSRQSYRNRLSVMKKMVGADEGYPFHLFRAGDDALVGACNLTEVRRKVSQSAALGYWIGERYTRQGYARAAVRAICRFGFETLGLHRIEAAVRPENEPSVELLRTSGFQFEGLCRGYLKIDGVWHDHHLYARLSSDGEIGT